MKYDHLYDINFTKYSVIIDDNKYCYITFGEHNQVYIKYFADTKQLSTNYGCFVDFLFCNTNDNVTIIDNSFAKCSTNIKDSVEFVKMYDKYIQSIVIPDGLDHKSYLELLYKLYQPQIKIINTDTNGGNI